MQQYLSGNSFQSWNLVVYQHILGPYVFFYDWLLPTHFLWYCNSEWMLHYNQSKINDSWNNLHKMTSSHILCSLDNLHI